MTELTVSVLIYFGKCGTEVSNLRLGYARRNVCQGRLSKSSVVHVLFYVADHLRIQLDEIILLGALELDPGVIESFLSR